MANDTSHDVSFVFDLLPELTVRQDPDLNYFDIQQSNK